MPVPDGAKPDEPFLDGGDIVAIIAVLVAIAAAVFSYWAARANQAMVAQQAEANRLAAEEIALLKLHRQEDQAQAVAADAEARAARAARAEFAASQIAVELSRNGGVEVEIRNDSAASVQFVRLVDLAGERADWSWKLSPYIPTGNRAAFRKLAPGAHKRIICVFVDEHGQVQRTNGERYAYRVRFTDVDGERWEVRESGAPQRVDCEDGDLDEARAVDDQPATTPALTNRAARML